MRIGLLQEGDLTGTTASERYHQLIEEVSLADRLGFSTWGTSEQHFSPPNFSVAAPEVLYSAIAMRTKNIKLRTMASVMLRWNHPILVASAWPPWISSRGDVRKSAQHALTTSPHSAHSA